MDCADPRGPRASGFACPRCGAEFLAWCRLALALAALAVAAVRGATAVAPRMLLLDAALTGTEIVTVGERGTILRSTDQGRTWESAVLPTRTTLTGVTFAPGGENSTAAQGWAVGHDALILATPDGGRSWRKQFPGGNLQDSFLDVVALDAQRVIAVGAYGLYASTEDAGKTWSNRRLSGDDFHFNRISRGPTGTLYLAGEHGTLLRSMDRGATWTPIPAPYEGSFYGVLPLAERTLLAYGLRGHVYRSTDDGASWTHVPTPQPVLLSTAVRTRDGAVLIAGQARTLLMSRDDGRTFAAAQAPPGTAIAELILLPRDGVLSVGEAGVIIIPTQ